MDNIYDDSILLIGGMSIGKSTISKLLSEKTNMKVISTDAVRSNLLNTISNYSFEKQLEIRKEKGYKGEMEYLIPYTNKTLNKVIDELSDPSIIDIGAFFKNQLTDNLIEKIKQFKNIVLLYSDNNEEILKRRNIDPKSEIGQIYLETLNNNVLEELCTRKINVDNQSPEEIVNEIVKNNKNNLIRF